MTSLSRSTFVPGSFFLSNDPNWIVLCSQRSNWIVLAFQRSIPDWPCGLVLNDWLAARPTLRLQPLGRPMWSVRDTDLMSADDRGISENPLLEIVEKAVKRGKHFDPKRALKEKGIVAAV